MAQDYHYRGDVAVFDLDDTLAPEREYCKSSFRFIAKFLKERLPDLKDSENVIEIMTEALENRLPHYDALEDWLSSRNINPKEVMPELVEAARSHTPDTLYNMYPGTKEVLDELRRRGTPMGLITDGRAVTQRSKIKALGLEEFFPPEAIFISGEQGVDKHSPNSFEAMVRLYPEAHRFWYFGDNPEKDFKWPNLLGWNSVCMLDTDNTHIFPQPDSEPPYKAQRSIKSIREVPALLS